LSSSTKKKVIVRRFDREPVFGLVDPGTYLQPGGVEIMAPKGAVSILPFSEVKSVCFVRDFDVSGQEPELKLFHARPKMEGLWVRMLFRDGELMDGLLPNKLLELDSLGFTVVPPNPNSNNQKIFVPRTALQEFHVLAVIGSPLHPRKTKPVPKTQLEMFE